MRAEKVAESRPVASLLEVLKRVPDHRTPEGRQHTLPAVLALVTVATICGCQGQRAIGAWGRLQSRRVRRALGFRKVRTPAHSTIPPGPGPQIQRGASRLPVGTPQPSSGGVRDTGLANATARCVWGAFNFESPPNATCRCACGPIENGPGSKAEMSRSRNGAPG